ncbi:MAG: twin-arginine translocase TatA/TatE family subunit [Actinobacteria bacterium]|nr:twin-arginine translocase TatA/TatE family subunit [Actinomycetota bacterium]
MNLGPTELLVVLAIILLLFGAKKLPDLARSLGKSTREFKHGMTEAAEQPDVTATPGSTRAPDSGSEQRQI